MSFVREGVVFIVVAALIAVGAFALALNRRSWPMWLLAVLLTIIAIWVAYSYRVLPQAMPSVADRASPSFLPLHAKVMVNTGDTTIAGSFLITERSS